MFFVPASYATFLKWLRAGATALGAGDLGLSTHSLRRSGASELSRLGMPLHDLLSFGRCLNERSHSSSPRGSQPGHAPMSPLGSFGPATFELALLIEKVIGVVPLRNVNSTFVQRLETLMMTTLS